MILYNSVFALLSKHHNASQGHILCLKEFERMLWLREENVANMKECWDDFNWNTLKLRERERERERESYTFSLEYSL